MTTTTATTAPATRTALARCTVKGCRSTVHLTAVYDARGIGYAYNTAPRTVGAVYPDAVSYLARTGVVASRIDAAAMPGFVEGLHAVGLVCADHDRVMLPRLVAGTVNPDKECDGRCRSARGASCDCSCGGEHHGANYRR